MLNLEAAKDKPLVDWRVGDKLKVIEGPFEGFCGEVVAVLADKPTLSVSINIFGRITPVELEWTQLEKL